MYQCGACESAYLDPRPDKDSISLAYERYFTHSEYRDYSALSLFLKVQRSLKNGYRNHHYGTRLYPANRVGVLIVKFLPKTRLRLDAGMRDLPRSGKKGRLLDIGCGNGEFLLQASSAGWDVVGVDFDAKAVETARTLDLDIRHGGVEIIDSTADQFDIITMAHVIEHLHDPVEALRACLKLLKPGGSLWIDTPNISSDGHRIYGAHWRGLEPPRHLVLFTVESLRDSLLNVGFVEVRGQPYRPICDGTFRESEAIRSGLDPNRPLAKNVPLRLISKAEKNARENPGRREFVTLKAIAPS